ncbi:hypothetical protein N0Y54_15820 [Nostoc punctiforme UO1]|uniref:hypothetical protein n=1 Tax=Nostoc punctiforme TaxID=272131 RepID=UPI0030A1527E
MTSKNLLEIMLTEKHLIIREGTIKEDSLIAKYFYQIWLDIDVDESTGSVTKVAEGELSAELFAE